MSTVINEAGPKGFLKWMRANQPVLYRAYLDRLKSTGQLPAVIRQPGVGLFGLGDDSANPLDPANSASTAPASSSWIDSIKNLFTGAAQIYLTKTQLDAQQKILNTQLQRAQMGLPPLNIDPTTYGLQPTVGVGLSPQTKTFLMYGGLGLGALWLLSMFKPRRS